ncbi:unnamed protein product [Didymodactylos carnosus]|uniref:Uncharacterized protein n=1 Tax=Didymodactylos carnosus TaxID=1234261 RepID=A0A815H367_9BILA|nr:unnamed protein product [Didymodactylos carnosus]CAF1356415.1 unnamed protein product [Didymodactylos carnosus]CAF4166639.1 unnamed protein product [Didymodactylos carnosus]CAF4213432.1 unnamed protein product [Didymodactylos carnosus]
MKLHLRGHLQILPQLDQMAAVLVESVIVGRDPISYNRISRQHAQVIERAIGDLNKITAYVESMQQETETALSMINDALADVSKQKKSGETQKYIGGAAVGAGTEFIAVGTASGVKLALTSAAIMANPVLALMVTGTVIGAGGFVAYMKGAAIQVDSTDLTKTLKAIQASFHRIRTLTEDQRTYLLEMQGKSAKGKASMNGILHEGEGVRVSIMEKI